MLVSNVRADLASVSVQGFGVSPGGPGRADCARSCARRSRKLTSPVGLQRLDGGATGEEEPDSLSQAQILVAGVFLGRVTREIGKGWVRGRFEYGADFLPLFVQFTPQRVYGTAFDPIILRWNLSMRRGRVSPFGELGGGGVYTPVNFPAGNSSTFNFIARGGGGIRDPAWSGTRARLPLVAYF